MDTTDSISSIGERLQLLMKQRDWINQIDINGNQFLQKKKQLEEQKIKMKQDLEIKGKKQFYVSPNGNCFYLSVADQLHRIFKELPNYLFEKETVNNICGMFPKAAKRARYEIALHMLKNKNRFREQLQMNPLEFKLYIKNQIKIGEWAGEGEVIAASELYNIIIECHWVTSGKHYLANYKPIRHGKWEKEVSEMNVRNTQNLIENVSANIIQNVFRKKRLLLKIGIFKESKMKLLEYQTKLSSIVLENDDEYQTRINSLKKMTICCHQNHFWSTCPINEVIEDPVINFPDFTISDDDSDEEEDDNITCQVITYQGKQYLLGSSPESEKNKIFSRDGDNEYLGDLIIKENGEEIIDFNDF